ncbi:membrane protein insertase YidC [Bacillus sp. AK128]
MVGVLSACQSSPGEDNLFQTGLVNPFIQVIDALASVSGDNYGIAIIVITILIRLLIMPFMIKQYKAQQLMKGKMESMQPEMLEIQEKLKNTKDQTERQKLQQEMLSLYKKHDLNPFNMGCLPLLIQMPILMGLFYAIQGSSDIASHSFLWFSLGEPDFFITLIAGVVYYLQFKVTQSTLPSEQQKQMKLLGLLSPIMIIIFSFSAPAALPLYWGVGGLFLVIQSFVTKKIYSSITQEEISVEKVK